MQRFNFRFVLIVTSLISFVIIYLFIGIKVISTPEERTGADFIAFYSAGMIAKNDGSSLAYDLTLQKAIQEKQVGFSLAKNQILIFTHTPFIIPVLTLLVNDNYILSFIRWMIVLVSMGILSAGLLVRSIANSSAGNDLLFAAGILTFYPFFISLINGQDTIIVLFGLSLCLFGLVRNRDWVSGLGLSLTLLRPQIALVLALPFLFKRRKILGYFLGGAVFFGLISFLLLGVSGIQEYVAAVRISLAGNGYGVNEKAMVNLIGLLLRIFPSINGLVLHGIGWLGYAISVLGLASLWKVSQEIGVKQFGIAVLLSLFFSIHLHFHDLALLLIPITVGIYVLIKEK